MTYSQSFSLTAQTGPTAPAQAANAGFKTLVFNDDFTTTTSIATSSSATSGYNWYYGSQSSSPSYSVNTTAKATGNAPSPSGGILTINGIAGNAGNSGVLQSAPGSISSLSGYNAWSHSYMECYAQFSNVGGAAGSSYGWPGFWTWSLQALQGYGNNNPQPLTEVDFMEYDYTGTSSPSTTAGALHEWSADMVEQPNSPQIIHFSTYDGGWHKWGGLWVSTGSGTGTVSFYMDDVLQGSLNTGNGTTFPLLEGGELLYLALSAGGSSSQPWPVNFDWVRVWQ